jgi:hypothetical protein
MTIEEILTSYKTVAVYGMSTNAAKPSNYVPVYLMSKDYDVIPINPTADEIAGKKAYHTLAEVPDYIEILDVFRPSEAALGVVEEAIERRKAKGDIEVIWLQEGIINDEAKKLAQENGIIFVQDACMKKEYERL